MTDKSVVKLMEESQYDNPITEIRNRARKTVLVALENGWQGPPFNAIELAKLLKYEISPNDSIYDARTIGKRRHYDSKWYYYRFRETRISI